MAKVNLSIQVTDATSTQLFRGAKQAGSQMMVKRILSNGQHIASKISSMLIAQFNDSVVARSLRGQGPEDLAAQFGLSDSTANALADGMAALLGDSVQFVSVNHDGFVSIRIQAVDNDWNKYLSLPGAKYISQPSKIEIPVAKWLLINPNIDIGQAAYDIVFLGKSKSLDAHIQKVSRSGRAIMLSLKSLGGSGGYVLPSIISGQGGENFIEHTLGQKGIAIAAASIVIRNIR